jgi:hypothetical protein
MQSPANTQLVHDTAQFVIRLERDKSLAPSLVPPGASVRDLFYPASYITWTGSKWDQAPIYRDEHPVSFTLGLFLTLEIAEKKQTFSYRFAATKDWPEPIKSLLSP